MDVSCSLFIIIFYVLGIISFQGRVDADCIGLHFNLMTIGKTRCSVQSFSHVRLFATPWTTARQASLSITNTWSLPKLMSIELVMPSNHLILCHPLLLLPSIFPSIRVFSNGSALHIRWPKYWSFSFNIILPMNCILLISNQFSPLFFSITQIQSSSLAIGNSSVASTNSSLESSICQQWTAGLGLSSSLNS